MKFYLVAMLFILFDIEAIFLYPWAVVYKQLKMFAFLEMLVFVVLILAGFFFIWKKGVLDWAHPEKDAVGVDLQMPSPETLRDNPLAAAFDDLAATAKFELGELTVKSRPTSILEALRRAKDQLQFERLSTVTGVDRYPAEPRFEVVYHLQSVAGKQRLRVKARLSGQNPEIESAAGVYRSANWYERETFDLFGIRFLQSSRSDAHHDARRLGRASLCAKTTR